MLYYGDKYRKMKVLEKNFYFFYPPISEILKQEKKNILEMEFYFILFLSSNIRFKVKKSVNQKMKKTLPWSDFSCFPKHDIEN